MASFEIAFGFKGRLLKMVGANSKEDAEKLAQELINTMLQKPYLMSVMTDNNNQRYEISWAIPEEEAKLHLRID